MICLMPNCAYLSETSRMILLFKALRAAGSDARIATHGGTHESLLNGEGIPYDIVGPRMSEERCRRFRAEGPGIGRPDQSFYGHDEMRTYVLAEAEYFRQHGVRAAVTGFTLTALLSSRLAGIPVVAEHAGCYLPPLFERGLLPAASRSPAPMFDYMPRRLARFLQNKGAARNKIHIGGFNALAAELGVEPIPSFPALLMGDLTLVTEAPEVLGVSETEMMAWRPAAGLYRPSTRLQYGGPIFAELDLPIPQHVESALNGGRPVIYVALTSTTPDVVRSVVNEVSTLDARIVVAGTIHDLSGLANANVTVGGVLPSQKIMPRVDLAVTTGGQGSLQCAMASGAPVVAIPLQPEQDANIHFLVKAGAARSIPLRDVGAGSLAPIVRQMLGQPEFRAAARRIQAAYARRDGPRSSAEAILNFIAPQARKAA